MIDQSPVIAMIECNCHLLDEHTVYMLQLACTDGPVVMCCQVMMEMKRSKLHVYELPACDEDEDESFKAKDKQMKAIHDLIN